jgi:hypothetical protein
LDVYPRFKYALDNFCEDFCYSDSSIICWIKYFQDLSNPDFKQDFDYEKYDWSHIQNAIIEKNEKGKLKIEPIKEEEIERAIKNLKPGKSQIFVFLADSEIIWYQRMTLS